MTRSTSTHIPLRLCASVAILLSAMTACETGRITTSDGRPLPPPPREAPPTPSHARANRMAFMVGSKPDDTNNNGCPDLIRATVALFATPHPTAIRQSGTFIFTLYPQGQSNVQQVEPLRQWRVTENDHNATLAQAQYGPCYQFQLSLLDQPPGDQLPLDRADLVCCFEPTDLAASDSVGPAAVASDGVRTIQVGGRRGR